MLIICMLVNCELILHFAVYLFWKIWFQYNFCLIGQDIVFNKKKIYNYLKLFTSRFCQLSFNWYWLFMNPAYKTHKLLQKVKIADNTVSPCHRRLLGVNSAAQRLTGSIFYTRLVPKRTLFIKTHRKALPLFKAVFKFSE